jgi:hypothetical protein
VALLAHPEGFFRILSVRDVLHDANLVGRPANGIHKHLGDMVEVSHLPVWPDDAVLEIGGLRTLR